MNFNTAIPSSFSSAEVCVSFDELEETMLTSYRGLENLVTRRIDNDVVAIANLRSQGREEKCIERSLELQQLNLRHSSYIADCRKALAFCFSKAALRVLMLEMSAHDLALKAKAGRPFCNTTEELERAIESVENRLSVKPKLETVDVFAIAKKILFNTGSVRLQKITGEKLMKISYATSGGRLAEAIADGWTISN